MDILQGVCASGGIAVGRIKVIKDESKPAQKRTIQNVPAEIERLKNAVEITKEQIGKLYEKTLESATEEEAEIFQIHIMMLEDGSLTECCESIIYEQSVNAEYAVTEAADILSAALLDTKDDYMMGRTTDIEDIKNELLSALSGEGNKLNSEMFLEENTVIFAHDLTPSQTVRLDKNKIAAFVTEQGTKNSHAAILARTMKIPSIIGVGNCINNIINGEECIVNGEEGTVFISPDEKAKSDFNKQMANIEQREQALLKLKGKPSITKNGKRIKLYANIGSIEDLKKVTDNDAEGIGLFRSEFLYIGRHELPDEETQFKAYKKVLEYMQGKETIIRTLDIGADKTAECLKQTKEENPAMGYRGIRMCLDNKEIFTAQLRALLRASVYGKLSIMFPMIVSKEEVITAIKMVEDIKCCLKEDNIPYDENIKIGIMIETPAAALISDELAPLVDFFSIGTNDLVQYTLACDRQNHKVDNIYNQSHSAVLQLIKTTCHNAHTSGIWVGICGEMAADTNMTETLLELGADELSVSPSYVLPVRERIINSGGNHA